MATSSKKPAASSQFVRPSARWTALYTAKVCKVAEELGRPICGSPTKQGVCEWPPAKESKTGRCVIHGAFAAAVARNRNARKHGIYALGIESTELGMAEEFALSLVNKYNLDLSDAKVKILIQDIVVKTLQIMRGNEYVSKYGVVVREPHYHKDGSTNYTEDKTSPALDAIVRLSESRRRDFESLGIRESPSGLGLPATGNLLDPSTRDAMILMLWEKVEKGEKGALREVEDLLGS